MVRLNWIKLLLMKSPESSLVPTNRLSQSTRHLIPNRCDHWQRITVQLNIWSGGPGLGRFCMDINSLLNTDASNGRVMLAARVALSHCNPGVDCPMYLDALDK